MGYRAPRRRTLPHAAGRPPTSAERSRPMSVLDRAALEDSPLADLHALASELGIDGFRRLRREALIDAILERQGGEDAAPASAAAAETDADAEVDDAAEAEAEPDADERPRRGRRRGGRGRTRRDDDE